MADQASDKPLADADQFATTHWSVVLSAGHGDDTRAQAALTRLCQTYLCPLYAFVRRHGHSPEDAKDLTQGFFAYLLQHHGLAGVHPAKGKFRSSLPSSLRFVRVFLENGTVRECNKESREIFPWQSPHLQKSDAHCDHEPGGLVLVDTA